MTVSPVLRDAPGSVDPAPQGQALGASDHDTALLVGRIDDGRLDEVGRADEVRDEPVDRSFVQLRRVALLLDQPVSHDHDHVAHRERFLLVVGHVHEGDPDLTLEGLELELHLLAQLEVQGTERLVQEQHRGPIDERTGQGDALLLPA